MGIIIGVLLFILNLADALFTSYFIVLYGIDIEVNPIARAMVHYFGVWWLIPKILIGAIGMFAIFIAWDNIPRARYYIVPIFIFYCILTIYHVICFRLSI